MEQVCGIFCVYSITDVFRLRSLETHLYWKPTSVKKLKKILDRQ